MFIVVQSLSCIQLFATPWTARLQASLSITKSQSLLKLMSIESVTPSNHLIFCRPLLLLPSIFPSIRVFPNESVLLIRWPKYWSFSFSVSPSNEYSGLISFRIDQFDLLDVERNSQESSPAPQFKSLSSSVLSLFMAQLSHLYIPTRKTIALTSWRRLLRVPWTARKSNQTILKEIIPGYSLEGLMLKLKLQYFGHLMWKADSLQKTLMLGNTKGMRWRGWHRMRFGGWHHWLNEHEFEQTPRDGEG